MSTIEEPPSEEGKTVTTPTHPMQPSFIHSNKASETTRSKGQETNHETGAVPVMQSQPEKALLDEYRKEYKTLERASGSMHFSSKGQEGGDDLGAVPVIPSQPKKASLDEGRKHDKVLEHASGSTTFAPSMFASRSTGPSRSKVQEGGDDPGAIPGVPLDEYRKQNKTLEHASGTLPFAPTMLASRSTEPTSMADRDLASNSMQENTVEEHSVPGAFPVFPVQNTTRPLVQDHVEPETVTDISAENEIFIPHAFSVEEVPAYAHAYVANDVDNGVPPMTNKSSKRLTPALRCGIVAGALSVIALIVTLVVVFAVNRPPAIAAPVVATEKEQYVQYQVYWAVSVQGGNVILNATGSNDFELTCLAGGSLKSFVINQFTDEKPGCSESDSTVRCTQRPGQPVDSLIGGATMTFQCHGTNPDQFVGQATTFEANVTFNSEDNSTSTIRYATHMIQLQTAQTETGTFDFESECSDAYVEVIDPSDPNITITICASEDYCTGDGVNECKIVLDERSEVQQAPVKSDYIQNA